MDLGLIGGVAMLIAWAIATFFFEAPGWVHLFLTLGVSIVIWRIVKRGTEHAPPVPTTPEKKKR